jgi:indole-3-glycerol phosphate synthase
MTDILSKIVDRKREEIRQHRQTLGLDQIKSQALDSSEPRHFFEAVTTPADQLRVIAEIKKASPSAGVIRPDFDPQALARDYHQAGAATISCLTDESFFQGSLEYIGQIKQAVPLPVLRKDFIVDPYQVYQSRAAGADAILLIAECIPGDAELLDLLKLAIELKLTVLVEVHDVENLLRVRPHIGSSHPGSVLLGINNRDLKSMTTDVKHTLGLLEMFENTELVVSESGIRTHADIQRLQAAGVNRVLVGEHLMRQADVGLALKELMHGKQ